MLNKLFILTLVLISISVSRSELDIHVETRKSLLAEYAKKGDKQLFKVWHFLFNKEYDYNSIEGIRRYNIFRENLKRINQHNSEGHLWKKGINHLTDLTDDEFKAYYHIKEIPLHMIKRTLRNLQAFSLDDYDDRDPEPDPHPNPGDQVQGGKIKREAINHKCAVLDVRDQKNCGSCWAFTTMSVIEGMYNTVNPNNKIAYWLSTQQLVDCDTGNYGCNGGWYTSAINYFKLVKAQKEDTYPYKAIQQVCSIDNTKATSINTTGYTYTSGATNIYNLLKLGPVAVAVDSNLGWYTYAGGIFDGPCAPNVNHAVTLIGYGTEESSGIGYWVVKNSWSSSWGEGGFMRVKENTNNASSCMIEKYGYQPKFV